MRGEEEGRGGEGRGGRGEGGRVTCSCDIRTKMMYTHTKTNSTSTLRVDMSTG